MTNTTKTEGNELEKASNKISGIRQLVDLNLKALQGVDAGTMDNRKAVVIFMGTRTVTGALKLALEAKKAGIAEVAGVEMLRPEKDLRSIEDKSSNGNKSKKKK